MYCNSNSLYSNTQKKNHIHFQLHQVDTRTNQEKSDDLIKEYLDRLDISKASDTANSDIQARLDNLRGIDSSKVIENLRYQNKNRTKKSRIFLDTLFEFFLISTPPNAWKSSRKTTKQRRPRRSSRKPWQRPLSRLNWRTTSSKTRKYVNNNFINQSDLCYLLLFVYILTSVASIRRSWSILKLNTRVGLH